MALDKNHSHTLIASAADFESHNSQAVVGAATVVIVTSKYLQLLLVRYLSLLASSF